MITVLDELFVVRFSQKFQITFFSTNGTGRGRDNNHVHINLCAIARYEDRFIPDYIEYYTPDYKPIRLI
jgi:hypothetical protein